MQGCKYLSGNTFSSLKIIVLSGTLDNGLWEVDEQREVGGKGIANEILKELIAPSRPYVLKRPSVAVAFYIRGHVINNITD